MLLWRAWERASHRRGGSQRQTTAAFCEDYSEPQYDLGHMVARADMNRSEAAMVKTFTFANMVPQEARFNQQLWRDLEERVRDWAEEKDTIFVITGVVLDRNDGGARDADSDAQRMRSNNGNERVAVPSAFYKIVLHERPTGFVENITSISLISPKIVRLSSLGSNRVTNSPAFFAVVIFLRIGSSSSRWVIYAPRIS